MILLINKPLHWTSFDVVKKLRSILHTSKIGHAGTLDPLATGLLIICSGSDTKSISHYQNLEKTYTGSLVLGKTTPSVDLETDFNSNTPYTHITANVIHQAATTFIGTTVQIPPAYSAIKLKGERAYKKARKGEIVKLLAREVFIRRFSINNIALPQVDFEIVCGKGAYVRSLVRDLGEKIGVGAYLKALCRTHIGEYQLKDAEEITSLQSIRYAGKHLP